MAKQKINKIINKYKREYSSKEIVSSVIKKYIHDNNISLNKQTQYCEIAYYIEYNNENLFNQIKLDFNLFTLKKLESIFESLIDLNRKKSEGAVYTPDYIIDYIINYSLKLYKGNNIPVIVDPACGSGGFIVRAIDILIKKHNITIDKAINYIRGIDVNKESVSCAKIIIELFALKNNVQIKNLDTTIINENTLLTKKTVILEKLNLQNGIDVLATNPPYVKLQNIPQETREKLLYKYPQFTLGSYSFSMLFLIAGFSLLSKKGVLGYITQNNFFTSLASKNIRQHLQKTKTIHTIIDFLHSKVFENASAYTCLLFLTREETQKISFKWALNPKETLETASFSKINLNTLNSKKWRLAPSPHLENIYKIESLYKPLGEISDIKVGFATLKDSIFLLDNNDISKEIEKEITVPAIKIADLDNENTINEKIRKIIFPYKYIDKKYIPFSENEFKEKYPIAYKYLSLNKDILATRSSGKKALTYFYEWGRIQSMERIPNKLLTKTFSGKPNFMLDKSDSLFCNGYAVIPKKDTIDILVLQKILNSSIMNYYSKLTSFQLNGNYQCFQKNFIELFNIPNLSKKDIQFIENNNQIEVDKYLSILYDIKEIDILEIVNR